MTKDIYIATEGEYSDYHVLGVFESATDAAKYGEVETFTLNQCPEAVPQKCWVVTVKNAGIGDPGRVKDFYISEAVKSTYSVIPGTRGLLVPGRTYQPHLRYSTEIASFISPEHARKLAVELIQHCLRQYHLTNWDEDRTLWSPETETPDPNHGPEA